MRVPREYLGVVLSTNCVGCFINHLALPDRYLHRAAQKSRKAVLQRSEEDHLSTVTVLTSLLTSQGGDINFDSRTKTKTIEPLLVQAAIHDAKACIALLDRLFAETSDDEGEEVEFSRQVLAGLVVTGLRGVPKEAQFLEQTRIYVRGVLCLLARYAYFDFSTETNDRTQGIVAPSQASRSIFRTRISSCLSHIISHHMSASHVAYNLICDIRDHEGHLRSGRILLSVDTKIKRSMARARQLLSDLNRAAPQRGACETISQSAILLLCLILLEVYNEDPDSVALMEDLLQVLEAKQTSEGNLEEFENSAVFVEILLSLLSKQSLLFRRTACQVFTLTTKLVDEQALQSMFNVRNDALKTGTQIADLCRYLANERISQASLKFSSGRGMKVSTRVRVTKPATNPIPDL